VAGEKSKSEDSSMVKEGDIFCGVWEVKLLELLCREKLVQ
jgi:hypothetical protein